MNVKFLTLTLTLRLSLLSVAAGAVDYKLDDAHSTIGFSVRHMGVSNVKGDFGKFEGSFALDDKSGNLSAVNGKVDVASISTGNAKRDQHLKSGDFFEAEKHPSITFKMTKYEGSKTKGKITGDFTMKGVTKPITFDATISGPVKDPWGNDRVGVSATGKVNRQDFGLSYSQTIDHGGLVVGNDVALNLEVEGTAQKPSK